jgi:hypothetical protein
MVALECADDLARQGGIVFDEQDSRSVGHSGFLGHGADGNLTRKIVRGQIVVSCTG